MVWSMTYICPWNKMTVWILSHIYDGINLKNHLAVCEKVSNMQQVWKLLAIWFVGIFLSQINICQIFLLISHRLLKCIKFLIIVLIMYIFTQIPIIYNYFYTRFKPAYGNKIFAVWEPSFFERVLRMKVIIFSFSGWKVGKL